MYLPPRWPTRFVSGGDDFDYACLWCIIIGYIALWNRDDLAVCVCVCVCVCGNSVTCFWHD